MSVDSGHQYKLGLALGLRFYKVTLRSRATSANSSSVKSVSQLTVQLTEIGATGP